MGRRGFVADLLSILAVFGLIFSIIALTRCNDEAVKHTPPLTGASNDQE